MRYVVGALMVLVMSAFAMPAMADSLPNRGAVAAGEPAGVKWGGIGVGVYGSWINGQLDTGSPINIGSDGTALGGQLSYGLQAGSFVAEVFGEYGFLFGNLKTLGADAEYALGGKAGILMNPSTLVYGLGAKSWIDTDTGLGTIDGWQFGGGVAVKLPSTPLFVSMEYRRGLYEIQGIDANTDTVRLGLTYKFGQ
jgi:opacity protein-like surface antigen